MLYYRQELFLPVISVPRGRREVTVILSVGMRSAAIVAMVFGFACVGVAYSAANICAKGRIERPVPSDVGIILGAYTDGFKPSPPLTLRLRAGLHLYRRGLLRYIIVSGGKGMDESVAEATSMKRFLVLNGVPADVILEERRSSDTAENLVNSLSLMKEYAFNTAVIITSDYHLPRALNVARSLGMKVSGFASISHRTEFRFAVREVFAQIVYRFQGYTGDMKG